MPRPPPPILNVRCSKCGTWATYSSTITDVKSSQYFHIYECSECKHDTWIKHAPWIKPEPRK